MMPAPQHVLCADAIARDLSTRRIGRRVLVLPEVDSTNTYALNVLAREGPQSSDGAVIFAERQTQGRGRLGRAWHAPVGAALTFTVLLWEQVRAARPALWMTAAAIAVARGIEAATDVTPAIRWPNDIYVGNRKLAGILVEAVAGPAGPSAVAIGIGLNCLQRPAHFPAELRDRATSLDIESHQPIDRAGVARAILTALDAAIDEPQALLDAAWLSRSDDLGQHVTLTQGHAAYTGHIVDIHPSEGLLLQLDSGGRRLFDPATTSRS